MVFDGKDGRLHATLDVELSEHALHMHFDGGFGEIKRPGNFLVGDAARQPRENFTFAGRLGIHVRGVCRRITVAAQLHHELARHLRGNDGVARHRVTHALQEKVRINLL